MSDEIKQAVSQAATEIATNPKAATGLGAFGVWLSTIGAGEILTVLSIILVTVSIYNQLNVAKDRKKAAKDDRSND